jgi:hypothetical protein
MSRLPDLVTHNYDPQRGAFRNLCALPESDAQRVLDAIAAAGTRTIKANYLPRRLEIERWLQSERRRKLGAPHLERPIYLFLGDMADGLDPSRPESVMMPLSAFGADMLTFTYPDSMASLPLATDDGLTAYRRRYHGEVFTRDEITAVVEEHGMPDRTAKFDRFIEVQVWDDRPIQRLLRAGAIAIRSS